MKGARNEEEGLRHFILRLRSQHRRTQDASCPRAENVFYELWERDNAESLVDTRHTVTAYGPVSRRGFTFNCNADSDTVKCIASAYASWHDVG
jgi:hypothetical protein